MCSLKNGDLWTKSSTKNSWTNMDEISLKILNLFKIIYSNHKFNLVKIVYNITVYG